MPSGTPGPGAIGPAREDGGANDRIWAHFQSHPLPEPPR